MHEGITFNTWFIWLLYGLFAAVLLAAVAVVVSALRRPTTDFGRWGRAPWLVVQGGLLAVSVAAAVAGAVGAGSPFGAYASAAMGLLLVAAAAQQIAYLLRVVFPSPARHALRTGLDAEASTREYSDEGLER